MYDTHVHSTFSHDGKSGPEEYKSLVDRGIVKEIGFAEHRDFMPGCGGYGTFRYRAYRDMVDGYREEGYSFYAGAELDYGKEVEAEILEALQAENYDYTICSVHMVDGISLSEKGSVAHFENPGAFLRLIDRYYEEVKWSLTVRAFDVIGHIGIYRRYLTEEYLQKQKVLDKVRDMEDEIARECAPSGKILEVNTSGLFAPSASVFATAEFLKTYYACGGRRISLGSDAHRAADVGKGFEAGKELLKAIGFRYLYLPWDKERPVRL